MHLLTAAAAAAATAAGPSSTPIRSGVPWFDTNGDRMYAGGGNLVEEDGAFFLVGEGEKTLGADAGGAASQPQLSAQFNLYRSTDLQSWTPLASPLTNRQIVAPSGFDYPHRMERPKLFRCPGAAREPWRLVFHCDSADFKLNAIGVLTAAAVTGPYTFAKPCFQPDGEPSFDMGTFVDARARGGDGRAYLVRSVRNEFAGISAFDAQCLNTSGLVSRGPRMEGVSLLRDDRSTLHLAGSHLTGWSPNPARFLTTASRALSGAAWSGELNPSGSRTTFDSQSSFVFPFVHQDGHTTLVWMADRWNADAPGGLDNMTLVWLPLLPPPDDGGAGQWSLRWRDQWSLDEF